MAHPLIETLREAQKWWKGMHGVKRERMRTQALTWDVHTAMRTQKAVAMRDLARFAVRILDAMSFPENPEGQVDTLAMIARQLIEESTPAPLTDGPRPPRNPMPDNPQPLADPKFLGYVLPGDEQDADGFYPEP